MLSYSRIHQEHILAYHEDVMVGELKRDTDDGWVVIYDERPILNLHIKDLRDAKQFLENKVMSTL